MTNTHLAQAASARGTTPDSLDLTTLTQRELQDIVSEFTNQTQRKQEQIDRLLTATERDQQVIAELRRSQVASSPRELLNMVSEAIEPDVQVSFESVDDEEFTVRIVGATIRDGEIVAPIRRFLIEGTITAPVAFYVEAANQNEAEELGDDILSDAAMSTEHALDMADPNDSQEFRAGIVEFALDDISED